MKTSMRRPVDRRESDIKKKLTAAVAMLLVSCIMVVTSTYAWFTLSTAPEISGIQTTIGGNGNLEIALATGGAQGTWQTGNVPTLSEASDDITTTNASWGNLINVAEGYGTNLIRLAPAKLLSTIIGDVETIDDAAIAIPSYGADGRVQHVNNKAIYGTYVGTNFVAATDARGFRALGISAEMSERQRTFISALSTITNKASAARSGTSGAMQAGGATLGAIAFEVAMGNNVLVSAEQYQTLSDLLTATKTAVSNIEDAIIAALDAYLASSDMQPTAQVTEGRLTDEEYKLASAYLNGDNFTLDQINVNGNTISVNYGGTVPASFTSEGVANIINKYKTINDDVNDAIGALTSAQPDSDGNYTWSSISPVMSYLMNTDKVTISNKTKDDLKKLLDEMKSEDKTVSANATQELIDLATNMTVQLNSGSGIYYDIATLVGNISVNDITIPVSAMGMALNAKASLTTTYTAQPILPGVAASIKTKQPSNAGSEKANVISDVYAYALDLLFRTNADASNLLLQTEAIDRIYAENQNTESATFGGGSTMTFTKSVSSFSDADMLNLIKHIKIVLVDNTNTVLAKAKVDTDPKQTAEGTTIPYKVNADGSITAPIVLAEGYDKICALTKNEVKHVSVLVYLDGTTISNADVANAATSMTATMNLQFSSSATLVPMEYKELYQGTTTTYKPSLKEDERA